MDPDWVIEYARQHCYPFGVDLGTLTEVFAEYFAAHDPAFNVDAFRDACNAASEEACERWEAERR